MQQRLAVVIAALTLAAWSERSAAYSTYSQNRDATNCAACHGNFQAPGYVSLADGTAWGTDLMSGHNQMVSSECGTCHQSTFFPVSLDASLGGQGLSPTACVGCHGREQDAGHDSVSPGRGAGLRQHHFNAGVEVCAVCHSDSSPASYSPVPENVLPADYFTPDPAHPNKPTDPCNANGSESHFGSTGLDNDGNDLYDSADPACVAVTSPTPTVTNPTPTPTSPLAACVGDCNGNHAVTVNEIIVMVNITLDPVGHPVSECPAGDADHGGTITVNEIIAAVNNALNNSCPAG